MDAGALAAIPVIVAGVLLLSGLLKFGDRQATADSMVALRVPFAARLGWFAAWQPWLELGLGLALLVLPGWGFLAAGGLVALFFGVLTVVVARAAMRPEKVHCNCFGTASTEPVGGATVLRNLVLTAAALLVALGVTGTDGPVVAVTHFDSQSVTWLVAITAGALAFGLLWFENRRLARRLQAVRPGAGVPDAVALVAPLDLSDAELVTVAGDVETVRDLAAGHALLLVFVQLECHACSLVVADLPEWTASLEPAVRVRIATSVTPTALAGAYPEAAPGALHGARGIRTALGIDQVPAAVLIGRDLTVAAGPVLGPDEIGALVGGIQSALRF